MKGMQRTLRQSGFTVLELLVVVTILSVIAGAVIAAFGPDFIRDKQNTAARYEMTQIRDAILKFKRDNPGHVLTSATLCSPADATFLLENGFSTDSDCETIEDNFAAWDLDYRTGWNGPYITEFNQTVIDIIETDILHDGSINTSASYLSVPVIPDPFGDKGDTGNPYYFFELDDDVASLVNRNGEVAPRIVSFGADGNYDGLNCDPSEATSTEPDFCSVENLCSTAADSDDLVLCL